MNFFLLLKNELSLAFLRNLENIVQTLRCAIRIWSNEDTVGRKAEEVNELTWISKILSNTAVEAVSESEGESKPDLMEEAKEEQFKPDAESLT